MDYIFIKVQGIVQGVGFRPFVKNLADCLGLSGYVVNTSEGVEIKAGGESEILQTFTEKLKTNAPAVSHIVSLDVLKTDPENFDGFIIKPSKRFVGKVTLVSPDLAICQECATEIENSGERRFQYPFTNCTNCGPRYSITESLPYDRPNTVMKSFDMCGDCSDEYGDKADRRFHAQPIACPTCGPSVRLNYKGQQIYSTREALEKAAAAVDDGEIIAVKGMGGYHLICDAYNDEAVAKLRRIKRRGSKPLAVMVKDVHVLDKYIKSEGVSRELFLSPSSPIVLFDWDNVPLSRLVNPMSKRIGVMRAYTPLHYLLFNFLKTDFIVATSGNLRDEPISLSEEEAESNLKDFTDIFLHHNRPIFNRIDDSVAASINGGYTVLRRARGFAPFPVMIKADIGFENGELFAAGANLKSGIAFYKDGFAFLSQYIGDLDNVETEDFYGEVYNRMGALFGVKPSIAVKDIHPSYRSSIFADKLNVETLEVQHHLAHFASCLCENAYYGDAIGVIMDGFGLAPDKKSAWGGEFFVKEGKSVYRRGHLRPFIQPGLDASAKHPCRMAFSYIYSSGLFDRYASYLKENLQIDEKEAAVLKSIIDNKINSVYTTSAGRLFEAAGSIVLGCRSNNYEGELAVNFESLADKTVKEYYLFPQKDGIIDQGQVFGNILDDIEKGVSKGVISAKFHNGFARAISELCINMASEKNINTVALSGGVFQNIYLLNAVVENLSVSGLQVLIHKKVPAGDQGIALGQLFTILLKLALK